MKCSRSGRFAIAAAFTAALLVPPAGVLAGPTPTPTPAPVFKPFRVRTERLTASGLGSVVTPFKPLHIKTEPLKANGLGTVPVPFKPLRIRTDALGATGLGTGGTK